MPPYSPEQVEAKAAMYLEMRSKGFGAAKSAELAGTSMTLIKQLRTTRPDFTEAEAEAKQVAIERLDKSAYDRALDGDRDLTVSWLKAHDRENWGADRKIVVENKHTLELTATKEGIVALEAELNRRLALKAAIRDDVIDAESYEDGDDPFIPTAPMIGEAVAWERGDSDEDLIG